MCPQRVDKFIEAAVHNGIDFINGKSDPVVGYPSLGEIICSYAFASVTASDLGFSVGGTAFVCGALLLFIKAAAKHFHRLIFIFILTSLVLTFNHHSGWKMGDSDCGAGFVDVLSAGAA